MLIFAIIYLCICAIIGYFLRKRTNEIQRYFILLPILMIPPIIFLLILLKHGFFIIYGLAFISFFKLGHTIIYLYNTELKSNIIKFIEFIVILILLISFILYLLTGSLTSKIFIISLVLQILGICIDISLVFINNYLIKKTGNHSL